MFLFVAMQAAGKQANITQQNWLAVDSSLHKFLVDVNNYCPRTDVGYRLMMSYRTSRTIIRHCPQNSTRKKLRDVSMHRLTNSRPESSTDLTRLFHYYVVYYVQQENI